MLGGSGVDTCQGAAELAAAHGDSVNQRLDSVEDELGNVQKGVVAAIQRYARLHLDAILAIYYTPLPLLPLLLRSSR